MTTSVDGLRSTLEAFYREASMEHYLHSSGQKEALEIFRRYARLRYRLLPYLYSAALRAAEGVA